MSLRYRLARPLLFALDPEQAHRLAIRALAAGAFPGPSQRPDLRLMRRLLGLTFPNPIGLAAGFDKNARVPDALLALGFGFVEVGTVTPLAQPGNPRPRLFRLAVDDAIINRLGFNNEGYDAVHRRLSTRLDAGLVGVNIGANRDSRDRPADYAAGVARFADIADYLAINVSSPNTPGLRDLQERDALGELLLRVAEARAAQRKRVPLFLKVAPDLDDDALAAIARTTLDAGIEGMIVANTTTARDGLGDPRHAGEAGGLSGRPLFRRSTRLIARLRKLVGPELVLIGAGGIDSAETAFAKITAGADLVQLYTGLVFQGPSLPARIVAGLPALLERRGLASIADAVGIDADKWIAS